MSEASPPPPRARGPSDELDLSALGATLWRKKWTILRPTILVALITLVFVQFITPRYQSESRVFIESRDNIYLRPDVDKDTDPERGRRRGGDQPGADHSVARSRPRGDRQAQARRAARIRSGAQRRIADQGRARSARSRQRSAEHDSGRARARSLLRSADGDAGRQIARHQYRLLVPGSRACRPGRQRHRRRLSDAAARGQGGPGQDRGAMARRRNRNHAAEGRRGRSQGRGLPRQGQSAGRQQQHHAVGAERSATSTPSSPPGARRRPTPRPRPR